MELLTLGMPIPERWQGRFSNEGGGVLSLNKSEFQFGIGFPGLSRQEVHAGQSGKIRMGLLPYGDALIIVIEVGGILLVDTSFDPSKVHPDERGTPPRKSTEGFGVTGLFFDTARNQIMGLRFASVTPPFSDLIEGFVADLNTRMENDPDFDAVRSVQKAYAQYPSPADMLKDCVAVEILGQKFRDPDETITARAT